MRKAMLSSSERGYFELPIDLDRMPTQSAFIHDWTHRFQAYGGGLGNGKTAALCFKIWTACVTWPHSRWFLGRWDGKELRQTTIAEWKQMFPSSMFIRHNEQQGVIQFKDQYGGSELLYGDLKDTRINNLNLSGFAIDQAEEVSEQHWEKLVGRLRKQTPLYDDDQEPWRLPNGEILYAPTFGFATFNPEGTSSYLYRFFHDDSAEKKANYQLYMATTFDGLAAGFTTQQYVDDMLAVFSEQARKRYLEGSWDVFEGRIYPEFDQQVHRLDAFTIPPHWKLYESIDHGLINPTACGWWAVGDPCEWCGIPDYVLTSEYYQGGGKSVSFHAANILAKRFQFTHKIEMTLLDSACFWENQSKGALVFCIADEYRSAGLFPIAGQKDWAAGTNRVRQALQRCARHRHPITDEPNAPHFYYVANCSAFEREMLGYRWKTVRGMVKRNNPDAPIDVNDHHMDAMTYFFVSRPQPGQLPKRSEKNILALIQDAVKKYNPLSADTKPVGTWASY